MLKKLDHKNMGKSDLGWLQSIFHFSFAKYFNPLNINFGALRVINDDLIAPGTGFDTHPHEDMEIVSYVVEGELTHADSMKNESTLSRGHVQYMSAGTGVSHSEHNLGKTVTRILQIWIYPDRLGHTPQYGEFKFDWESRHNRWFHIVSPTNGEAPVKIHQDANIHVLQLVEGNTIDVTVSENRQAYLVQIEGSSVINEQELEARDALEILEEELTINAKTTSHFLLIEMRKAGILLK
jgi:redox-sensitive bicupin YhaK (pirin superfamily)